MHVKRIYAKDFRRFTEIEVTDLPRTAKLVVLAGPNGNGKSSLFDLLKKISDRNYTGIGGWEVDYHSKITSFGTSSAQNVELEFHEELSGDKRKAFYFRTAYRNEPQFKTGEVGGVTDVLAENRFQRLIDNDTAVSANYRRLYAQGLVDAFENDENETLREFRQNLIGDLQASLKRVLPELSLDSLGNPFKQQAFRFTKGVSRGFNYKNLSGGEKAAFDLLLDMSVKRRDYDDTVFCIDEPEAHLNPRVHAKMLDALFALVNDQSQLWIATHSIGMLRRARDLYLEKPSEIVFLDFEADFDVSQVLRPIVPGRAFWQRSLEVALDDLADLVAPQEIIACESGKKDGLPGEGVDSLIYNTLFGAEFPETRFVSIGSTSDMKGDRFVVVQAVADLVKGAKVSRLIDRDGMSDAEVAEYRSKGYRVLSRRHLESYMFDDELLILLCDSTGQAEKKDQLLQAKEDAIRAAVANGHPHDHMKAASGRIADACRKILPLKNPGRTTAAFMKDTLLPLVGRDTGVYRQLRNDVFGERAPA